MTYNQLLLDGQKRLKESNLDVSIAKTFLAESASLTLDLLYANLTELPSKKVIKKYIEYLNSYIRENKPLQYLLKKAYFYNLEFYVDENVLIPRPETEGIVEIFTNYYKSNYLKIIDVGTGSGCLAITLNKLFPNSDVYGVDISKKALKVAKKNNKIHNTNVTFMKSDLFSGVTNKFDVIVANLPYVSTKENLDDFVLKEPKGALFAGSEGIDLYQRFFNEVYNYLNEDYLIIIEHGFQQKDLINAIIKKANPKSRITTLKDLNGKDRYTIVSGDSNELI